MPPALLEPTPTTLADGVDQTRIVVRTPRVRFRLTFGNGEDHQVVGHSILGRRPTPQPGDESPRLITISDPERSVSKTHLELGIENGTLWISDRWSSNGTVLVTPHGVGRICDPGRRYEVEAGSTVEIGDVTFIVSTL
ncbi:FHA domain-containing protein [uncultured Leifsonia sp.]|uniref:FHA domain-containing protein n=1 Tax=uncultured Leifsonia sp. TaxID=340359 RepID=UPI0025F2668D|nr:FHA domain-containing protein [uncultured Leifsonia sp.]